tara:strand:- start:13 stop:234 length:222 start_codon:yes stop_codon:yes gene_type:complete
LLSSSSSFERAKCLRRRRPNWGKKTSFFDNNNAFDEDFLRPLFFWIERRRRKRDGKNTRESLIKMIKMKLKNK